MYVPFLGYFRLLLILRTRWRFDKLDLESVSEHTVPKTSQIIEMTEHSFEVHVGIIAACIPALRPGYKWLCQKLASSRKSSSIHLPLADVTHDKSMGDCRTTVRQSDSGETEREADVSGHNILRTTTIDVEQGPLGPQRVQQ